MGEVTHLVAVRKQKKESGVLLQDLFLMSRPSPQTQFLKIPPPPTVPWSKDKDFNRSLPQNKNA